MSKWGKILYDEKKRLFLLSHRSSTLSCWWLLMDLWENNKLIRSNPNNTIQDNSPSYTVHDVAAILHIAAIIYKNWLSITHCCLIQQHISSSFENVVVTGKTFLRLCQNIRNSGPPVCLFYFFFTPELLLLLLCGSLSSSVRIEWLYSGAALSHCTRQRKLQLPTVFILSSSLIHTRAGEGPSHLNRIQSPIAKEGNNSSKKQNNIRKQQRWMRETILLCAIPMNALFYKYCRALVDGNLFYVCLRRTSCWTSKDTANRKRCNSSRCKASVQHYYYYTAYTEQQKETSLKVLYDAEEM